MSWFGGRPALQLQCRYALQSNEVEMNWKQWIKVSCLMGWSAVALQSFASSAPATLFFNEPTIFLAFLCCSHGLKHEMNKSTKSLLRVLDAWKTRTGFFWDGRLAGFWTKNSIFIKINTTNKYNTNFLPQLKWRRKHVYAYSLHEKLFLSKVSYINIKQVWRKFKNTLSTNILVHFRRSINNIWLFSW